MSYRACSVEGCCSRHFAKDLCATHYSRFRRTGNPYGRKGAPTLVTAELARLRALVGLPPEGPSDDMRRRWATTERLDSLEEAS